MSPRRVYFYIGLRLGKSTKRTIERSCKTLNEWMTLDRLRLSSSDLEALKERVQRPESHFQKSYTSLSPIHAELGQKPPDVDQFNSTISKLAFHPLFKDEKGLMPHILLTLGDDHMPLDSDEPLKELISVFKEFKYYREGGDPELAAHLLPEEIGLYLSLDFPILVQKKGLGALPSKSFLKIYITAPVCPELYGECTFFVDLIKQVPQFQPCGFVSKEKWHMSILAIEMPFDKTCLLGNAMFFELIGDVISEFNKVLMPGTMRTEAQCLGGVFSEYFRLDF